MCGSVAERLPDHAAPAGLEGAADVVFLVGRRRRGQPEGIGRLDADEVAAQVGHGRSPSARERSRGWSWRRRAPSRRRPPSGRRPPGAQSPPAQTFAMLVRPSASVTMRSAASASGQRLAAPARGVWPMAVSTCRPPTSKLLAGLASLPSSSRVGERHAAGRRLGQTSFGAAPVRGCARRRWRELLLEAAGRHLLAAAAVDDGDLLGAELLGLDAGVDRGHAAADHHHPAADREAWRGPRPGAARR